MMEKIKDFYGAHPIRWTLLTLIVLTALFLLIWFYPSFSMQASEIPVPEIPASTKGEEIIVEASVSNQKLTRKAKTVEVASQNGRTLELDPVDMILTLKENGKTILSSAMAGGKNNADKALLMIEYYGEDRSKPTTPINSYENGTILYSTSTVIDPETNESKNVDSCYDKIYRIDNGVRIEMRILDTTKKYFAYLPQTMSLESYNFFMDKIKEFEDAGIEMPYKGVFMDHYREDPSDKTKYPFFTGGTGTSNSAQRQLISLAEQVGYTYEMLLEDCGKYGSTALSPELYDFSIVLEVTLDERGELIVRVPTNEIVNHNDYFKLTRIHVLPNLCASTGDGYYFVPDGAGALMRFNATTTINKIERPFMNNDYYQDYYWQSEHSEELMMPVFGVMFGGDTTTHGALAIIEQGAEIANLHVTPDKALNKAYASIDVTEMADVRIFGAYAENTASYKADSGMIMTDFTVRYIPYNSAVTYFDMAMDYRDYLARKAGVEPIAAQGPGVYLELLGAITRTEHFMGVPYDSISSMTTYAKAQDIVEELKGTGATIQYDGMFNGGVLSALNKGAALVSQNGSEGELKALLESARENGNELFFQMNLSRVYDNGRNYIPYLHAARDFSNTPMSVYLYRADTAQMNGRWNPIREYTVVSPRYFAQLAESVRTELDGSELLKGANLAIGDLAHDIYADYRYHDIINLCEGRALALNALDMLDTEESVLALNDPFADTALSGKYAVNISRESSNHIAYYATVPFRQLALNGLTTLVSNDVNLNSRNKAYYLMQAAELGVSVKYTVSGEDPDTLKNTHFESMFAIHWDDWKDDILDVAAKCAELREQIGGKALTNHELLKPQVFMTTYEDGTKVISNYSALPYESTEGTVPAGEYILVPAVQEGGAE